jgi:hypothetical protein
MIQPSHHTGGQERHAAFISYPSRYQVWVQVLHGNLELCLGRAGQLGKVYLDKLELVAGYSWLNGLQTGIDQADKLILVVTPEALASPWVESEWQAFVSHHPDHASGRLV